MGSHQTKHIFEIPFSINRLSIRIPVNERINFDKFNVKYLPLGTGTNYAEKKMSVDNCGKETASDGIHHTSDLV